MRAWATVLKEAFETFPHTATWFLSTLLDATQCAWLDEFLLFCTDALARGTFVQIVASAVTVISPPEPNALDAFIRLSEPDLRDQLEAAPNPHVLTTFLIREVLDRLLEAPMHLRVADELFVLVRELAAIPCACYAMLECGVVSRLAYFAMPEQAPAEVKSHFLGRSTGNRQPTRNDFFLLLQSVFEALAALLGVPQMRKVSLLQERPYWESELVPEAREALTVIFGEMSLNGGMDAHHMSAYMEKVNGPGHKVTPQQVRSILDRFHTNTDGRLSLDGFLQYQTDQAWYNPKSVWKVS
jgi:hypothetical protein